MTTKTKSPQKTKRYLKTKAEFPNMTDEEYFKYIKHRRLLQRRVFSYKKYNNLKETEFLNIEIEKCTPFNIYDLNIKQVFYKHVLIENPDFFIKSI